MIQICNELLREKEQTIQGLAEFLGEESKCPCVESNGFKATGRDVRRCADLGLAPSVCGRKTQMVI